MTLKSTLIAAGSGLLALLVIAGCFTAVRQSYQSKILALQNELALTSKTVETQKDVFQRQTVQTKDLNDFALSSKDDEIKRLKTQLDQEGAQLLTANSLVVQLKKDLKSSGTATVAKADSKAPGSITVNFDTNKDLDPFRVTGSTVADCAGSAPTFTVNLAQMTPLKFSVLVSQDKDGTWRTSTTSSSDKISVDIALAGVNPYLLEEKWYEKISFNAEVGIGTNPGFLGGAGIGYEIGKFEVGPKVWAVVDRGASPYFGASLAWRPFKK